MDVFFFWIKMIHTYTATIFQHTNFVYQFIQTHQGIVNSCQEIREHEKLLTHINTEFCFVLAGFLLPRKLSSFGLSRLCWGLLHDFTQWENNCERCVKTVVSCRRKMHVQSYIISILFLFVSFPVCSLKLLGGIVQIYWFWVRGKIVKGFLASFIRHRNKHALIDAFNCGDTEKTHAVLYKFI